MKLPDIESLRREIQRRAEELRARLHTFSGSPALALMRPQLPGAPGLVRRVAEPLLLLLSLIALASLMAMGMTGAGLLVLAAALSYAILTQVFGLRLDLAPGGM